MSLKYLMETYKRFDLSFERGEGVYLFDFSGKRYLDLLAGIAVNVLGHSHPVVVNAVCDQAKKLIHVSNVYRIREQEALAQFLVEHSAFDKVFFANSGAEVNEAAIKLARLYGGNKRWKILSFWNSFHGRTLGSLAMTAQPKHHEGFKPLPEGFVYAEFNNLDDALSKLDDSVCACFVEFVQGEGGIHVADREFVYGLFEECRKRDVLFVADEVQTGIGRTGKLFAYEHFEVEPDIMCLAKALGGGVPIGALLARGTVAESFRPGSHGCTFGGNPLVCSVALGVVKYIVEKNIPEHARRMGEYMIDILNDIARRNDSIISVRGLGLMVGVEFKNTELLDRVIEKALDSGFLLGKASGVLRIEPPLIIEKEHIDEFLEFLEQTV